MNLPRYFAYSPSEQGPQVFEKTRSDFLHDTHAMRLMHASFPEELEYKAECPEIEFTEQQRIDTQYVNVGTPRFHTVCPKVLPWRVKGTVFHSLTPKMNDNDPGFEAVAQFLEHLDVTLSEDTLLIEVFTQFGYDNLKKAYGDIYRLNGTIDRHTPRMEENESVSADNP